MKTFNLKSEFDPAGDQPQAIKKLTKGIKDGVPHQTLLGVTGSGKTFTAASVIANIGKPTLVIAHNKTLAAQLAQEYREFFPENEVHYFVSYYDYYQPEAYIPASDTYIEKEAQINEEIERLRHATTQALLTRRDVIIVASVSCIYGLGNPEEYEKRNMKFTVGENVPRNELLRKLVSIYFERTNADLKPGMFRALGNAVEIMPVNEKVMYRLELEGTKLAKILKVDPVTQSIIEEINSFFLFPAKHFVTPEDERARSITAIALELKERLAQLRRAGRNLEAERLERRTKYDLAMIREIGYCNGIENYSRHFDGRNAGDAAHTLLSYFPHTKDGKPDFLTIIDESHATVPQIGGMHAGDRSRKDMLIEHGFRLPSALDNRPLQFHEFEERVGQVIYTSATPATYELEASGKENIAEQLIRPTGLIDPEITVKGVIENGDYKGQVQDFISETQKEVAKGHRTIGTTLTKKMAEDLSEYLRENGIKAEYLHSEIKTIERIEILTEFRKGTFDCLIGVNLLREGLDLPEVSFIGILDSDKAGFLRSETSLIQIIGRAARNLEGHVTLYADGSTKAMEYAIRETDRRRTLQTAYNTKHGITPISVKKAIKDITEQLKTDHQAAVDTLLAIDGERYKANPKKVIKEKEKRMEESVKILDFETAAILRDEIRALKEQTLQ
ncbi:excinuclease ABC subunit B [Candidatus Wolfebacteria bacterium]|nr:MAG: excinuclease ABC subunit B [Candidatus Wolfebacteria bacterium]